MRDSSDEPELPDRMRGGMGILMRVRVETAEVTVAGDDHLLPARTAEAVPPLHLLEHGMANLLMVGVGPVPVVALVGSGGGYAVVVIASPPAAIIPAAVAARMACLNMTLVLQRVARPGAPVA